MWKCDGSLRSGLRPSFVPKLRIPANIAEHSFLGDGCPPAPRGERCGLGSRHFRSLASITTSVVRDPLLSSRESGRGLTSSESRNPNRSVQNQIFGTPRIIYPTLPQSKVPCLHQPHTSRTAREGRDVLSRDSGNDQQHRSFKSLYLPR